MKIVRISFVLLIFLIFGYFYTNIKTYKKHSQFSKVLDTLSKHPQICNFSAKIDCSHPWGTQFFGFVYSQWFGNNLRKECYEQNHNKIIKFSLAAFDKQFNYQDIPDEIIQEISTNKEGINFTYASKHKISKKRLLELHNNINHRNIFTLQPVTPYVVYVEFKIKNQNNYFPYIISFYIIFDAKNNIKKIMCYPTQV